LAGAAPVDCANVRDALASAANKQNVLLGVMGNY
jgi:hypothetical protein